MSCDITWFCLLRKSVFLELHDAACHSAGSATTPSPPNSLTVVSLGPILRGTTAIQSISWDCSCASPVPRQRELIFMNNNFYLLKPLLFLFSVCFYTRRSIRNEQYMLNPFIAAWFRWVLMGPYAPCPILSCFIISFLRSRYSLSFLQRSHPLFLENVWRLNHLHAPPPRIGFCYRNNLYTARLLASRHSQARWLPDEYRAINR